MNSRSGTPDLKSTELGAPATARSRPANNACGLYRQPRLPGQAAPGPPPPAHLTQTRGSWSQSFTAQNPGRCWDFLRHLSIPTQKGNTFLSTSLRSLPTGVPPVLFPAEALETPTASPASWTPEGPVGGRAHKLTLWVGLGFYPKRKS